MCCRSFELWLEPDRDLFHPNFTLVQDGVIVDQHQTKSHMYSGTEAGQDEANKNRDGGRGGEGGGREEGAEVRIGCWVGKVRGRQAGRLW